MIQISDSQLRPHPDGKPREMVMRNGRKAWIHGRDDEAAPYSIVGFCMLLDDTKDGFHWQGSGRFYTDREACYDLISEAPQYVDEWRVISLATGQIWMGHFSSYDEAFLCFRRINLLPSNYKDYRALRIRRGTDGSINTLEVREL